jgi:hypothetical protein
MVVREICNQSEGQYVAGGDMAMVIVVDPDLSFAFKLGKALDADGYNAIPARSGSDALELLPALGVVPSLIILGIQAGEEDVFIARCRALNNGLRVIHLLDGAEDEGGNRCNRNGHYFVGCRNVEVADLLCIVNRVFTSQPIAARSGP